MFIFFLCVSLFVSGNVFNIYFSFWSLNYNYNNNNNINTINSKVIKNLYFFFLYQICLYVFVNIYYIFFSNQSTLQKKKEKKPTTN